MQKASKRTLKRTQGEPNNHSVINGSNDIERCICRHKRGNLGNVPIYVSSFFVLREKLFQLSVLRSSNLSDFDEQS